MTISVRINVNGEIVMLNKEQKEASQPDTGCSLIIAGAGTGKTATLVEKISAVIRTKLCRPDEIMLLTFSRAAAEEMKTRINTKVQGSEAITAGTFHSVALSFLREFNEEWQWMKGFHEEPVVISDKDKESLLSELIQCRMENFLGLPADTILWLCESSNRIKAERHEGFELIRHEIGLLTAAIDEVKREKSLIDFDDIISDFTRLIHRDTTIRAAMKRFKYIFIDEFQDITDNTLSMVKTLIPLTGGNLCAVGDDAQAVYSFMGSVPDHIASFNNHFPGARTFRLTRNYRSHSEIVTLSNRMISKNCSIIKKDLISEKGKGGIVKLLFSPDSKTELGMIAHLLSAYMIDGGSTAVLFRNNWQIRRAESFIKEKQIQIIESTFFITIHASKGLEYDTVILAGIEDGIFPGICSNEEEERRLLYVALTRAKKSLFIIVYKDGEQLSSFGKEIKTALRPFAGSKAVLYLDRSAAVVSLLKDRLFHEQIY